ncbi:aminopeptidase N [Candidatus Peregrinibacteria bacterium CG_4_9_14_0_2_um_filter_53_11]|nr:MAG: aminopeptidase N [Candidatus Peregrinibacteria bacterium CG_4_9_14_0_2_um_filter_53_11]
MAETDSFNDDRKPSTLRLSDYTPPYFQPERIHRTFDVRSRTEVVVTQLLEGVSLTEHAPKGRNQQLIFDLGDNFFGTAPADRIQKVTLDGVLLEEADFSLHSGKLLIEAELREGQSRSIETVVALNPSANKAAEGLYESGGDGRSMLVTQCESRGNKRIGPLQDRPDVMTEWRTTLIADPSVFPTLLSNGVIIEDATLPDGRRKVTYDMTVRMPPHLFAVVIAPKMATLAGEYEQGGGSGVKLEVVADPQYQDRLSLALEVLKAVMAWDEKTFGYVTQLPEYRLVATEMFNYGAMENRALNIFNALSLLWNQRSETDANFWRVVTVVAHEFFHDKTGNDVGIRDFFQLTLKEGLTTFREQLFSRDFGLGELERINTIRYLRQITFVEDDGPHGRPLLPKEVMSVENLYGGVTYEKGAEFFRMIQTLVGEEAFVKVMKEYYRRFNGQVATIEDLVSISQEVSGLNLAQFRESWLDQHGTPTCHVTTEYDEAAQSYTLCVRQEPYRPGQKPYYFPLRMGLLASDGQDIPLKLSGEVSSHDLQRGVLHVSESEQTFVFTEVKERPVASLMRSASAPMRLYYELSTQDLQFLMKSDTDTFNQWEASQELAARALVECARSWQQTGKITVPFEILETYESVLARAEAAPGLIAEMFALPAEEIVLQRMGEYDFHAAYYARKALKAALGGHLSDTMESLYHQLHGDGSYSREVESMHRRQLKNVVLSYLVEADPQKYLPHAERQFKEATNMTDEFTAYALLCNGASAFREAAVKGFYAKWHTDPLVFVKFLAPQATSTTTPDLLQRLQEIEKVPEYDPSVPNLVRALWYSFGYNIPAFHAEDGSGYRALVDKVIFYNSSNPHLAATLMRHFQICTKLKDPQRSLMRAALQRLKELPDLQSAVRELVDPILEEDHA